MSRPKPKTNLTLHALSSHYWLLSLISLFSYLVPFNLFGQTVDFSVDRTEGCAGFSTQFIDLSSSLDDPIVAWRWELGGVISTIQNPGRIFTRPGVYDICLSITTLSGVIVRDCRTDYITVYELPTVNFVGDVLIGCTPLQVNFEDQSTSPNGEIVNWIWDLGGSSSVIQTDDPALNISTTYSNYDLFSVTLSVQDERGCTATLVKDQYIETLPDLDIQIEADQTTSCNLPHDVQFSNLGLNDPAINYQWDFGNGQTFDGFEPGIITYLENGSYTIKVIGINQLTSCRDTLILNNYIQVGGEQLAFTVFDTSGCAPFTASMAVDFFQSTDSVVWDFGDGSMMETGFEVSHVYDDPGCYWVSVVKYSAGCVFQGQMDTCIQVLPEMIYEVEMNNLNECELPHNVELSVSTDQELSVLWEVGDSILGADLSYNYEITEFGSYPVRLMISNQSGCVDDFLLDTVQIIPLDLDLNAVLAGCTPLSGELSYQSNSISPVVDWSWEVYDGNSIIFESDLENPFISISDTGVYDVQLIGINEIGCIDTVFVPGYIQVGIPPTIDFIGDPLIACISDEVSFTNLTDIGNSWFWDFGDGSTSTDQHPELNYQQPGIFTTTLTAWHNGCPSTDSIPDYVEILLPLARFIPVYNCLNPFLVQFENNSLGADSVHWDFGFSGSYNTDLDTTYSPLFNFEERGTYTVTLTVFNFTTGCVHSTSTDVMVTDPMARFTVDTLQGCAPLSIQTMDASVDAVSWKYYLDSTLLNMDSLNNEPTIIISEPGLYSDLHLIVEDIHGCLDTFYLPDDIRVSSVQPGFTAVPNPACIGDAIFISDTSMSIFAPIIDRQYVIENYPDTFLTDNFSVLISERGVRNVELTVLNDWGCQSQIVETIEVSKPELNFNYDTLGCTFAEIQFTNLSIGSGLTYEWDFGDLTTSSLPEPGHIYASEGQYIPCLRATDQWGCITEACGPMVTILDPVAQFVGDTLSSECPPLIVSFENQSVHNNFNYWNFGDSSGISNQDSPDHIYSTSGSFDVQLIVQLNESCADTLFRPEYINIDGPSGHMMYDGGHYCAPVEITLTAQSDMNYKYTWDFGDGILSVSPSDRTTDTVRHIYSDVGEYLPKLILEDENGCVTIIEGTEYIVIHDMNLDFFIDTLNSCTVPGYIQAYNLTQSTSEITTFSWIISGPYNDTIYEIQPEFEFTQPGSYEVILVGENVFCSAELVYPFPILIGEPPDVNFEIIDSVLCEGDQIAISTLSSNGNGNGSIINRTWYVNNIEISQDSILNYRFDEGGIYEVTLWEENEYNCAASFSQNVLVNSLPRAELEELHEICPGESVHLLASNLTGDILSTSWYRDTILLCESCTEVEVAPLEDQMYIIELFDINGCMSRDTVLIIVNEIPQIQISMDTTICKYDEIAIYLRGLNSSDLVTWDSSIDGLSCYNCPNPMASPREDSEFFVTITNESGCSIRDTILIEVIPDTADLQIPDQVICLGDILELQSPDGLLYNWSLGGESCENCEYFSPTPEESSSLFIEWITPEHCVVRDTANIGVKPISDIDAGEDEVICQGELVMLEAVGDGQILWTSANVISDSTEAIIMVQPEVTTSYYLNLTEGLCSLEDEVTITVLTHAELALQNDTICPGDTAWIPYSGLYDQIAWNIHPDILEDNRAGFIVTESINVSATASYRTCIMDNQVADITLLPNVELELPDPILFYPDEEVYINVGINYDGNFIINWSPGDIVPCDDCLDFSFIPDSSVLLNVEVIDINSQCRDEGEIILRSRTTCHGEYIYIPDAFTPNDDRINDIFKIETEFAQQIKMFQIYDRWGNLIYKTEDISHGWDGTYKGRASPIGVYVYFIEVECFLNGRIEIMSGDLTLLR